MVFKKLDIRLFGELIQRLYDTEINFKIEWNWDTGFEWYFADDYNGFKEWSSFTKKTYRVISEFKNIDSDLEYQGGFIIIEYLQQYIPFASLVNDKNDKPKYAFNPMTEFLWEEGFMDEIHYDGGYIRCDSSHDGALVFDVYQIHEGREACIEGSFDNYLDALKRIRSFT